jgi:diadenosine tetraphosphate (Ap4A) HIT family hydrolase
MEKCLFCRPTSKKELGNLIAENEYALAFFDNEFREGHCTVILKKHKESISELDPVEYNALFELVVKVSKALEIKYKAPKTYLLAIGDQVHHFHFHLLPKHKHLCSMGVYCFQKLHETKGQWNPPEAETNSIALEIIRIIDHL